MNHSAHINGQEVEFAPNETILQVARRHGVFIPTLCEMHDLNHAPGVCRICLVELRRQGDIPLAYVAACDTPLEAGAQVFTQTEAVQAMRRTQIELLLAEHHQDCAGCTRHGDCELIACAASVGYDGRRIIPPAVAIPSRQNGDVIEYDASRCIRCQRCITVCREVQGIKALEFFGHGQQAAIRIHEGEARVDSACVNCGQCIMVCPTGALSEQDETHRVACMLADPDIITVFQIAPAVRVAFGAELKLPPDSNLEGQIVTALRRMGANLVLDTNFAADLVIMEEGHEVLQRVLRHEGTVFTSCCPGWVSFAEKNFPELLPHLSSTRSPQQCLGAVVKNHLAQHLGHDAKRIRVIAVMPCTAKKYEAQRAEFNKHGRPDVDVVLTLREFARLLQRHGLDLRQLPPSGFDSPYSEYSGAGAIFGTSGGVMEAAVRTLYHAVNGKELDSIEIHALRGSDKLRAARIDVGGAVGQLNVAICHGLKTARDLVQRINRGEERFDFVEVMACPGGCIVGGGHLRSKGRYLQEAAPRSKSLYGIDRSAATRQSHRNAEVQQLYAEFLGTPLSPLAHDLLHTHYQDRRRQLDINLKRIWKASAHHNYDR